MSPGIWPLLFGIGFFAGVLIDQLLIHPPRSILDVKQFTAIYDNIEGSCLDGSTLVSIDIQNRSYTYICSDGSSRTIILRD